MKGFSRSDPSILAILIVICLPFLLCCRRSDRDSRTANIRLSQEIINYQEPLLHESGALGIETKKQETKNPGVRYNILIPGRTTCSAESATERSFSIRMEGVSLTVPEGCMKRPEIISITTLLAEDLPPIPNEITNVTKGYYAGYRFLPHGMIFDSAATIAMTFDNRLIPEGYSAEDVYTFYFDESDSKWKTLERDSINRDSSLIVSRTLHFTDMINGIVKVPESPETEGFVPTTIKEIKAADPVAGITLIEAPVANSEGDAKLSYPLKIPDGRFGMQPQLALQYSSDGGSGWTGMGWELNMPGISVDLNWGVPHYYSDKESETYLFNGSQLTPVAHRGDYVDRTSEKRFYSRIEGIFSRIIRHGDNPSDYWWEVTTKEGVRSFYGGLPGSGIISSAVSMDDTGNIGFWAITETRDLHDNFISYKYIKPEESGQQFYIREITYTGHGTEEGAYKITFIRTDEDNGYERKDTRINARYGFIQRDRELLRQIDIAINDDPIRSYIFQYKEGAYSKTLLKKVAEYDASGKEYYSHRFDYYEVDTFGNELLPYKTQKKWTVPDDGLKSPYLNLFLDNLSSLGGSGSKGYSGSIAGTIGLHDGKVNSKSLTAGGNVTWMGSDNEGILTLVDLNGDGLPDKVYQRGKNVYYRPNLLSYTDTTTKLFGEERLVQGINRFSAGRTRGFGGGGEVHPWIGFVGYNHAVSTTRTNVYFDDFNADGLVDLVDNGIVNFNHINENGDPVFTTTSDLTPNPLFANSEIDLKILPDPAEEQAMLEAQFPLHDAVRMWQAPYQGSITINAPVRLIEDTTRAGRQDKHKDGVKVSIQHYSDVLWSTVIDTNNYSLIMPQVNYIQVEKGDRIFFRVQSRFNGSYDKVHWDPEILYTEINGSNSLPVLDESNGKLTGRFKASEDFLLCGNQPIGMPKTGGINIRSALSKPATSDSLKIVIIKTDSLSNQTTLFEDLYIGSQVVFKDSINLDNVIVNEDDYIQFRVLASTNIDWSNIEWDIRADYTSFTNDTTPVTLPDGKPVISYRPVPDFSALYNNVIRKEFPVVADSAFMLSLGLDTVDNSFHPVKVRPYMVFSNTGNDTILLSVNTKNRIIGKKRYPVNGNQLISDDTLSADIRLGDTLYFEYHLSDFEMAESNILSEIIIGNDTVKVSAFSPVNPEDVIFGLLFRGWGQFDYKGDSLRADTPINTGLLVMKVDGTVDIEKFDTSNVSGVQKPLDEVFNVMIPYMEGGSYLGTDQQVFILPEYISSSRLGEKDVYVEPYKISESGLNAFTKESKFSSNSVAGGIVYGPLGGSGGYSWGEDNFSIDMMDMNGDKYPDLVLKDKIQYTGVKGVLSGPAVGQSPFSHNSKAEAWGVTLGTEPVEAKSNNTGSKASAKTGNNSQTNTNANTAQKTSKASIGINGNFGSNTDNTQNTWLDINGDGMPDRVYKNGTVELNLGYRFAPPENWGFDVICKGKSKDYGFGLGINYDQGSIIAGLGISGTTNESEETFMDVNSDGLPDLVNGNRVSFNTGNGFTTLTTWPGIGDAGFDLPGWAVLSKEESGLDAGVSVGESVNAGFTLGITIPIPFFLLKLCINPTGSLSTGVSQTRTQLADLNGDGMPDFLSSEKEDELLSRSSTIFRTNNLKKIVNPLGSTIELDYFTTPAVYNNPGGKIALCSVKVFDGLGGDGIDTAYTTFEYEKGFYDRHEREFYGFRTVKTHYYNTTYPLHRYRTLVQHYSNSDYYAKGILLADTLIDSENRNQKSSQNIYSLRDIHNGELLQESFSQSDRAPAFLSLEETRQFFYNGASQPLISTRTTYEYDTLGNISEYTDYSSGNENDRYTVTIQYHSNPYKYLFSIPSQHQVFTTEGLRRKDETVIDEYGNISQIKRFASSDQTSQFNMEYDEFGNLLKITRPSNYKGERMWYEYKYDQVVHSFVTTVTDAYGYTSSSLYDYRWGEPVELTEKNNQKINYTYDDCGRMITLTGPYEIASGRSYTLSFEYHPEAEIPYAHTMHYDSVFNADIETYSFSDGLGRLIQVKKTALLFENPASEDTRGYIVSGKVIYDAFGRVSEFYQPVFEDASNPSEFNASYDNIVQARVTYDEIDRITQITLPDGSTSTHTYNIGDLNGESMNIDSLTDALSNITVTYTNADGRQAAVIQKSESGDILTRYEYNALGELIVTTDPLDNTIVSEYDMLGRQISIKHPDTGLTEFTYDAAGNMTEKITASLRKQIPDGGAVKYKYDHERLTEIVYPRNIQNRINYKYGEPGASFNRAGRLVLMQDATGGQEFFYGKLGEVIKTIRTIQLGESDMRTWIWSAEYDTWNRVQTMTYPDGEKVTYSYNKAGNLQKIEGEKESRSYIYLSRIGYDKYEKQVYLEYGNGSVTTYNYEPKLQRLAEMDVTSNNKSLFNNAFTYDLAGNVLSITNSTDIDGDIGGRTSHMYSYDGLYRLTGASGEFIGKIISGNYNLSVQYDIMGRVLHKNQIHKLNGVDQGATGYDFLYKYGIPQPGAATSIGDRDFTYDANGNQTWWLDSATNDYRQLAWDEENRLTLISDDGYLSRYLYDALGERVIKSHGGIQGVYINGAPVGIVNHSDKKYTVYVSPYFVFENERFTKHYYNGATRVSSKVGNGQFMNHYRPGVFELTAGSVNYINRQQQLVTEKNEFVKKSNIPPGPPTMKGIYADPLFSGTSYPDAGTTDLSTPRGWPKQPVFAPPGNPPGAPVKWSDDITNNNVAAGFGFVGNGNFLEDLQYFYHADHLGSTSYVTNKMGNITQFISYLPFGEIFIEQHSEWDSPYKFNARGLDSETGLYFFGSRYYDPKVSLWLSVDPLAVRYPDISSYIYSLDNPVTSFDWTSGRIVRNTQLAENFAAGIITQNNSSEENSAHWSSAKKFGSPGISFASRLSGIYNLTQKFTTDDSPGGSLILEFERKPTGKWVKGKNDTWIQKTKISLKKVGKPDAKKDIGALPEKGGTVKESFKSELLRKVEAREARLNTTKKTQAVPRQNIIQNKKKTDK